MSKKCMNKTILRNCCVLALTFLTACASTPMINSNIPETELIPLSSAVDYLNRIRNYNCCEFDKDRAKCVMLKNGKAHRQSYSYSELNYQVAYFDKSGIYTVRLFHNSDIMEWAKIVDRPPSSGAGGWFINTYNGRSAVRTAEQSTNIVAALRSLGVHADLPNQ